MQRAEPVNYYYVLVAGIVLPVLMITTGVYLRTRFRIVISTGSDLLLAALALDAASLAAKSAYHMTPIALAVFTPCVQVLGLLTVLVLAWSFLVEKRVEDKTFWDRVRRERVARPATKETGRPELARLRVLVAASMVLAGHVVVFYLAIQA